jgi:hypothetical protein
MTIESQSQLLNPKDKMAAKVDRDFKKAVQKELPTNFDVVVYCDFETEDPTSSEEPAVFNTSNPFSVSNFKFFRARSLAGHHDHMIDPSIIKNKNQREAIISSHFQAKIRIDHPNISQAQNGSIWNCTYVGGELVQLNHVVQPGAFVFTEEGSKIMGPNGTFANGTKTPLGNRKQNEPVEIKFKENRRSLINQAAKNPYKDFMPLLSKKLADLGFSRNTVVVTSMFRGPAGQVAAMMGERIKQGNSTSYKEFLSWLGGNYKGSLGDEVRAIVKEKDWSVDVEGLRKKLVAKVTEQYNAGRYLSKHMASGAMDLRTNDVAWSDVQIMLEALKQLQSDGFVTFYQIENSRTSPTADPPGPEHIHFSLSTNGASE